MSGCSRDFRFWKLFHATLSKGALAYTVCIKEIFLCNIHTYVWSRLIPTVWIPDGLETGCFPRVQILDKVGFWTLTLPSFFSLKENVIKLFWWLSFFQNHQWHLQTRVLQFLQDPSLRPRKKMPSIRQSQLTSSQSNQNPVNFRYRSFKEFYTCTHTVVVQNQTSLVFGHH